MLNKLVYKQKFSRLLAVTLSLFVMATLVLQDLATEAVAGGVIIPRAVNLADDGARARNEGIPVLLEFSMHDCPFCEQVETEVLEPMLQSGKFNKKVIVRRVMLDEDREIVDFNGEKISYEDLTSRYGVYVTPTLVLVNGDGKATGLEMVGVTTIDFYEAYLFEAIDAALKQTSIAADKPQTGVSAGSPAS